MDQSVVDSKWLRPKVLRPANSENEPMLFQQIDIDHYVGPKQEGFLGPDSSSASIIRMYGVTPDEESVLCHVHGFLPYFYVYTAKKPDLSKLDAFRQMLDDRCKAGGRMASMHQFVSRVDYVASKSIYGYFGKDEQHFLKIVVTIPQAMKAAQNVFAKGEADCMGVYFAGALDLSEQQIFENDLKHEIRFMSDLNVHGCSWIELPHGKYKLREQKNFMSRCQIECDINYTDFIAHEQLGDWAVFANFRILSFDLETTVRGHIFPIPKHDKVIQISNVVGKLGAEEPFIKCIFTVRSCAPIAGATIRSFETESEMLLAWSKFVVEIDPDILTGHNIRQFDVRYLLNRARVLNLNKFPYLGRIPTSQTKAVYLNNQTPGTRKNLDANIEGRVQFDILLVFKRDHKSMLQSFSLENLSIHFLNEHKGDVHYTENTKLFNGNEESRRKLAVYCLKDSELVFKILVKKRLLFDYIEMAGDTCVPLSYLVAYGKDTETQSHYQKLREAKKYNHILPDNVVKMLT